MAETESGGTEGRGDGLDFALSEDGLTLLASFTPSETEVPVDAAMVRQAIADRDLGPVALFDDALSEFIERCKQSTEAFSLAIGGSRDGSVSLSMRGDKLIAYLHVIPSCGAGKAVSRQMIDNALKSAGVRAGILEGDLNQLVDEQQALAGELCMVAARGRAAVHGEDAHLEPLVPVAADRRPRIRQNGVVDYRELGPIEAVEAETPVVRLVPPTQGESGMTVTGKTLPARNGKSLALRAQDASVAISADDPSVLVAQIAGRPVLLPEGAKVEPVIEMDHVDFNSGNVYFNGSVVVKGDVRTGMKVECSGDVRVGGTVEAATLRAGGSVEVGGGIIGHGAVRDAGGKLRHEAAVVQSGGMVAARFIENAMVNAQGSVAVKDMITHSEITSMAEVLVGGGRRGKGQIIGGITRAQHGVKAGVLGSPASVHTTIETGFSEGLDEQLREIEARLEAQQERLQKAGRFLEQARRNPQSLPAEMVEKLQRAQQQLTAEVAADEERQQLLQTQLSAAERTQVAAAKNAYTNVSVSIAGRSITLNDDRNSVTFVIDDGDVVCR